MAPRRSYQHTEHTDKLIRNAYASPDFSTKRRPAIKKLYAALGWPKHVVYRRAIALGVAAVQTKEPEWTAAEMAILQRHAHKIPHVVAKFLRAAGYHRTPAAIGIRIRRFFGGHRSACSDAGIMSATTVASVLGVSSTTVSNWIEKGLLRAKRRGTDRSPSKDTWDIRERDLRDFVIHYTAHVPFARVDKFWLVDLLVGSGYGRKNVAMDDAA